jgi:hypothetical protein
LGKQGLAVGCDSLDVGGRGGGLVFFGLAVLMRWMVIVLLVSVVALLLVASGVARHVWRQRRLIAEESADEAQKAQNRELDLALELPKTPENSAERPER